MAHRRGPLFSLFRMAPPCASHSQCPPGQRCAARGTDAALCVPGRPDFHFEDDGDRACASGARGHVNLALDRLWRGDGEPRPMVRCCPGQTVTATVGTMHLAPPQPVTGTYRFCAGQARGDPCTVDAQCAAAGDVCLDTGRPDAACGPRRGGGERTAHASHCAAGSAGYWGPADEAAGQFRCCPAGADAQLAYHTGRCSNLPAGADCFETRQCASGGSCSSGVCGAAGVVSAGGGGGGGAGDAGGAAGGGGAVQACLSDFHCHNSLGSEWRCVATDGPAGMCVRGTPPTTPATPAPGVVQSSPDPCVERGMPYGSGNPSEVCCSGGRKSGRANKHLCGP